MNILRGIVNKRRGGRHDDEDSSVQKERSLCIQHLRKLFLEFLHPPAPLSAEERELKQYYMFPLFLKAFHNTDASHLSERFGDVLQFAGHTSKLMVSEVQRRAANKSKVQASKDILVFLCRHNDEVEKNKGWNLINTIQIMTDGESAVIECMVAASLQSILVKCIKLFFSLPSNFGNHEKCLEVQKVIIPILVKLCSYPITAKELMRTDDLASLFEALTCSCRPEHMIWRSGVSEVLTSITRNAFTFDVIDYIYEKSCISLSLANIESICDDDPLAVVEMFVTLTCVLKDSADVSSVLLDSFRDCHGYNFLTRVLLNFSGRTDEAAQEASRNLVLLISSLVLTGYEKLRPSNAISTPFQKSDYTIPEPSDTQGLSIRNLDAFKVLSTVFLESSNQLLCSHILSSVQSLLNYDNANYFIIEHLHPFAQFIQKMPEKTGQVKAAVLKLVEFVALQLNWVPSQELVSMTILFKDESLKSSQCAVLNTLILLINHNAKYRNILREAGLIDVMVVALKRYSASLKNSVEVVEGKELSPPSTPIDDSTTDYLFLLMECLRLLIENNSLNADLFHQHGGSRCAHNLVPFDSARPYALRIIQQLIVDGGHDDLGTLLGLMHSTPITDIKLKSDVLSALLNIFEMNPQTRSVFQEVGGFVYVVSVLVSLEGSLSETPPPLWSDVNREIILELMWMTFNVLTSAMKDEPVNKIIFMDEIRFKGLMDTIKLLGCFSCSRNTLPTYLPSDRNSKNIMKLGSVLDLEIPQVERDSQKFVQMVICRTILSMATATFDTWNINFNELNSTSKSMASRKIPKIIHPRAVNGLVEILPLLCYDDDNLGTNRCGIGVSDVLLYVVFQLQHLIGSEINQQLMCDAELPYLLLTKCQEAFIDDFHPLNASLTKLFERLAGQSLYPKVLRTFLRLGSPLCSKSSYAVLRLPEKDQSFKTSVLATPNAEQYPDLMSLRITDGGIEFSCDDDNNTGNAKSFVLESTEFQSTDDLQSSGLSSQNSKSSLVDFKNLEREESVCSTEDEKTPRSNTNDNIIQPQLTEDEKGLELPNQVESDERSPLSGLINRKDTLESMDLNASFTSSINAVDRIESLLEEEFDFHALESFDNFKEEISRLCDKFEGRQLPQNLVKSVVSLTTPRDVLSTSPLEFPSFIEFDMHQDGYACLYIPALTPQSVQTPSLNTYHRLASSSSVNLALTGSTSHVERTFPPQAGLTFSTWVLLEAVPSMPPVNLSIGLLTVEKQWEEISTKRLITGSIFQIYLDLPHKKLVVNTEDLHVTERGSGKSNTIFYVDSDEIFELHKWNHICVVMHKNMMRTSTASVYVNGRLVANSKIKYIYQGSPNGADLSTCKTLAYLGTHPKQCHIADLVWRIGPTAIFEEPLSDEHMATIYSLGPGYIGCFQSPCITDIYEEDGIEQKLGPLISEDKILLTLNPHNVTLTTLNKLSSQCTKSDLDLLAMEMSISPEDKYTPIQLLPNSALHLAGANRPVGLFFIGSSGIRIFCPNPVASAFVSIGGMSILLCLVAMVNQLSELYASLKALTCILQSSRIARREMNRVHGYQITAYLLKKKKHLLNTHILHLVFSLVGTVRSDRESATIPNITAFNDLLCDLEIWHNTPGELERSLFSHFYELITQGVDQQRNILCLRRLGCVSRLVFLIEDGDISDTTLNTVASVLSVLLCNTTQLNDFLIIGQYLASSLPDNISEQHILLESNDKLDSKEDINLRRVINHRNVLLDVLLHLLIGTGEENGMSLQFCAQLYTTLGFDWLLLFLAGNVHKTTVLRAIRMLFKMLSDSTALSNFKSGVANGGWLVGSESLTARKPTIAAGFNVPESNGVPSSSDHEVNHQSYKQKGFPLLTSLLEEHTDITEVYFLLLGLLLKSNIAGGEYSIKFNIESLYLIFWPPATLSKIKRDKLVQIYCLDAIPILLHLVRKLMSQEEGIFKKLTPKFMYILQIYPSRVFSIQIYENGEEQETNNSSEDVPSAIIQFLEFLYQNVSNVEEYCSKEIFLSSLVATLFPLEEAKELIDFNVESFDNELDGGLPEDGLGLTIHPCKELVIKFLKQILIDTMLHTNGKISTFTDVVFEAIPSGATLNQRKNYQTEVINAVIDELISGPTWKNVSGKNDANFSRFLMNGVLFTVKVVDRLWLGYFLSNYKNILQFIMHLIQNLEINGMNVDSIFHSLNRVLLYQFAKPASRLTDQTNLLEVLHVLTSSSKIVFSQQNKDTEFIVCLTHWLLVVGLQTSKRQTRKISFTNISDVSFDESYEGKCDVPQEKALEKSTEELAGDVSPPPSPRDNNELNQLITAASERVWNVFYAQKKESIGEVFGIQSTFVSYEPLPVASVGRSNGLSLNAAKNLYGDQAARGWITFIGNEEKKKNEYLCSPTPRPTKKLSTKIAKTWKREKLSEEYYSVQETLDWIAVHSRAVKAVVKLRHAKHSQEILLGNQSAERRWCDMEIELIREGAIWGPDQIDPLEKWMVDDVEGPCRMRKRLIRNEMFYTHYPYFEQEKEQLVQRNRIAYSHDSKLLFQLCQKYINPNTTFDEIIIPCKDDPFTWRPQLFSADGFEAEDAQDEVNTQTIIQLLETGEKIYSMYRCARVRGLDSAEGLFLFGRSHFYVVDGFTLMSAENNQGSSNAKEIKDISSLPEGTHEPLIPHAKGNSILKRSLSKWSFDEIKEAHKRRYLLQDIAIEVFSNDGSNHLLVFPKQSARNKVYNRISRVSPVLANSQESVAGMNSDLDVEASQSLFTTLLSGERSLTQRWIRGEVSNFQYLMSLNTLAGRSYNDLMQYPIFPWVLADYTSEFLDLTNPATFRDLSKPMGAQGESRLKNYRKRFKEWEDPTGKIPAYYYGTHYSSAMIVASYLIRLEPFTQHFLRLQGGHFDLPDRLFHSIKDSWLSASESNMADVKELIPEFYYLPDFLSNNNHFDLGTKQNGEDLGDVLLPPWAKNDTLEFIRVHREALECDYVSSHLHEWIDLVFGYKQLGNAAKDADNVFHYLFYEKSVDLDTITDPLERKATIGFINNFGQMPKQLFKKPHPSKRAVRSLEPQQQTGGLPLVYSSTSSYTDKLFFHHLSSLVPSVQPVKELKQAVGQISTVEKTLAATETNKALFPVSLNRIGWGYGDFSLRYYTSDEKCLAVFEGVFTGQTLCAACLDSNRFVTGGTSTEKGTSQDVDVKNQAVCVWTIEQKSKDKSYSLSLTKVLHGHGDDVLSIAVSKAYNIIISGSQEKDTSQDVDVKNQDKSCIIWDLRKLTYTRKLHIPSGGSVTCIAINHMTGDIVTCAGTHLYVWTVNGQLLVQENTSPAITGQILSCVVSEYNEWDEANTIITGSSDGFVKFWGIEFYDAYDADSNNISVEAIKLTTPNTSEQNSLTTSKQSSFDSKDYLLVDYPKKLPRDWKRRLVLRHKLTMHTAFSRADNSEPASVTALAISKDHRKLFVGDSRGRIYSWSMADSVGRIADHWIKDEVADNCSNCGIKFTFAERKHHCRNCGNVFCGRCSRYESPIVHLRIFKAVRVCVTCYNELKRKPSNSMRLSR